jgi:aminoglycoside phosphotransferase (APT) family kinase protein
LSQHSNTNEIIPPMAEGPDMEPALAACMRRFLPGATGIAKLRRLSGGASQETWSFEALVPEGPLPLILRRMPNVPPRPNAPGPETEARVILRAAKAGVPVPPVRHVLDRADGLGRGYIMGFVAGETIARKILREPAFADVRPRLARRCGEVIAKVHAIPLDDVMPLRVSNVNEALANAYETYKAQGMPRPVFELAFRWLKDNAPAEVPPRLVHGDFRHGNLIIAPDDLAAVIDWEGVHVGDPMEDLGWICVNSWRFGNLDLPVGGFGTREEMFEGYEAAGGGRVDPERVRFWETFGTLRWGMICAGMAREFQAGDRSVERATIGRRASETEIDLLRLLLPRG